MKAKILAALGALGLGVLAGISISSCVAGGIALDRVLYARACERALKKNVVMAEKIMKDKATNASET